MDLRAPRAASDRGRHDGLAYELWLPESEPPWPGIVVIHGAGSCKENHADFGRLAGGMGWAAIAYDQRGHGESDGEMSPAALADVGRMARVLGAVEGVDGERVCARGSSMGGFAAIHATATEVSLRGAIAICPASESGLIRELRRGGLEMRADPDALIPWLQEHDLREAVALLGPKPLMLMHAGGDDVVPPQWSRELYGHAADPRKLVIVPGGHHRSVQHDPELGSTALRWLERELRRQT